MHRAAIHILLITLAFLPACSDTPPSQTEEQPGTALLLPFIDLYNRDIAPRTKDPPENTLADEAYQNRDTTLTAITNQLLNDPQARNLQAILIESFVDNHLVGPSYAARLVMAHNENILEAIPDIDTSDYPNGDTLHIHRVWKATLEPAMQISQLLVGNDTQYETVSPMQGETYIIVSYLDGSAWRSRMFNYEDVIYPPNMHTRIASFGTDPYAASIPPAMDMLFTFIESLNQSKLHLNTAYPLYILHDSINN